MDDDLFQSLGGSLMKDLLADLQGDDGEGDGWLSLEQLEKELSQLDDNTATATTASTLGSLPLPSVPTAASMVVTGQQQFHQLQQQQQQQQQPIQSVGLLGDVTVTTTTPADAWKESLQKFTALSLDQDFLAADTVRKQRKAANVPVPPPPEQLLPPGFLAEAEDYDDTEKVTIKPPPGILAGSSASAGGPTPLPPGIKSAAAVVEEVDDNDAEREQQAMLAAASFFPGAASVPAIPKGHRLPKTPQNSVAISMSVDDDAAAGQRQQRVASRMPKTPRNSVMISSADDLEEDEKIAVTTDTAGFPKQEEDEAIPMMGKVTILKRRQDEAEPAKTKMVPKTPRNSVIVTDQQAAAGVVAASAAAQGMAMPPPNMASAMMHGGMMPPQPGMHLPPPHMMHGMPPPPHMMHGMPPPPHMMVPHHPGAVPMGMPAPGGPAWQTGPPPGPPPQAMMPSPPPVFCNPHPNAPPIPAQILESRLMKSRDISYIIHSILKPVLMAGVSEHDYDIQLLFRQSGGRPAGPRPHLGRRPAGGAPGYKGKGNKNNNAGEIDPTMDAIQREIVSREKKAKEWSAKNAALGTVTKSNAARPRALIASPVIAQANQDKSESALEQKQRARLWKARIYCDQAYQAYLAVVDVWAKAAPGSVPREVQAPLIRLMKCLGIAPSATAGDSSSAAVAEGGEGGGTGGGAGDYKVDSSVLELFLKLSKGRTLFARIVEQALLPPSAVQAVLPSTLDILYKTPIPANSSTSASAYGGDLTDDRCFRALTNVIQCLPSLTGNTVLQCAEMMKAQSEAALSSTARMECLHALLQRGNAMANNPDAALEDYKGKWKETETSFLNVLSGM